MVWFIQHTYVFDQLTCISSNADNSAKGDGLVVYLKEPSVLLAMQILDGVPFRDGQPKAMTVTVVGCDLSSVQKTAVFQIHTQATFEDKPGEAGDAKKGPRRGPKGPRKKRAPNRAEEHLSWDGFDDEAKESEVVLIIT